MSNHRILPINSLADAQREIERLAQLLERVSGTASGGPPAGVAGGVLSGNYPDPGFAVDMATQAELDTAIAGIPPVDLSSYRTASAEDVITNAEATARAAGDVAVQAYAIQRANHTGTQANTTITGLGTASTRDVPASGDTAAAEVVLGNDSRLGGVSNFLTKWDSDIPPAVAHANDVDFVNGAVAWPAPYVDLSVPFEYQSFTEAAPYLTVRGSGGGWKGKAIAIPGGGVDFQAAIKFRIVGPGANFVLAGFHLSSSGVTGAGGVCSQAWIGYHNGHGGSWTVSTEVAGGAPGGFGDYGFVPIPGHWIHMRWRRLAGLFSWAWSYDGRTWLEGANAGIAFASAAFIQPSFYNSSTVAGFSTPVMGQIAWIRWLNSGAANAAFGANRTYKVI